MATFSREPAPSDPPPATTTIGGPSGKMQAGGPSPGRRGHLGWIVAASLTTGLLAALLLVAAPFVPVTQSAITAAVLLGFAVGWAMLFWLSRRFTDQPQRWAVVPAAFLGAGGLVLLAFGSTHDVLSWIWPPALLALVVWMVVRVHRDMRSRGGRVQLYAVSAVLGLCAVGGGWQTVSEATTTNPFLASGRLIDVGGHQLRLDCTGSGGPTVVLEPGAGGTSASMGWITPVVARQTRVCVYDRAGRGGSDPAGNPQDGAQVAADLHTLLHRGGVPGPYVLAGHSFGGLYVRTFAARYPDEVTGLVLIDSTASELPARSAVPAATADGSYDAIGRFATFASLSADVGLARLYGNLTGGSLPARYEEQLVYDSAQAHTVRSVVEEYLRGGAATQEAASLRDFGDKPLYVLTAGSGNDASWVARQNASARLSTNSAHQVVGGADHQGLLDDRRYAAQTSQGVLEVVSSVRSGRPLRAND